MTPAWGCVFIIRLILVSIYGAGRLRLPVSEPGKIQPLKGFVKAATG